MKCFGLLVLCGSFGIVFCDYSCLCSYNTERDVYSMQSNVSDVIGYLYEFDCKPLVNKTDSWYLVAFEHKIGYIEQGDKLVIQTCPGDLPDADKITSSNTPSSSVEFKSTASTNSFSIIAIAPSSSPVIQTSSTEKVPTSTLKTTTPAPAPSSTITTTTTGIAITTQTSSSTVTTIEVTQSVLYACKVLTHQSNTSFAFNRNCYELVTHHRSFSEAEGDCMKKGGHLAHIKNDEEQQFITSNVLKHNLGDNYIWIGLHDTAHEENFVWTSGEPLSYTHWYPGRKDLFLHGFEDCVSLKMKIFLHVYDGAWEDLPCNIAHAYICQFDLQSGPQIFG